MLFGSFSFCLLVWFLLPYPFLRSLSLSTNFVPFNEVCPFQNLLALSPVVLVNLFFAPPFQSTWNAASLAVLFFSSLSFSYVVSCLIVIFLLHIHLYIYIYMPACSLAGVYFIGFLIFDYFGFFLVFFGVLEAPKEREERRKKNKK